MTGLPVSSRIAALLTLAALAAGCTPKPPVRPQPAIPVLLIPPPAARPVAPRRTVEADPPRCPTASDVRRLRAARPKPLRSQAMPSSPAERVARTSAQLGLYEARKAWADQVEDMLEKCAPD